MAYTPTLWAKGDIVTSEKLNKIEQGIVDKVDKVNGKTLSTNDYTNEDKAKLNGLESQIDHLESLVGSPLVASTAAEMTDEDKVYVYTGSETGYQNGNWYYYDGTAWTQGGVYNSVAINVDDTLSISGVPADSKKTGDEINDLKEELSEKVSIEQGTAHAGEALIVGADGNVTTGEAGVSVDPTLSIEGKAADAKATGDAIDAKADYVDIFGGVSAVTPYATITGKYLGYVGNNASLVQNNSSTANIIQYDVSAYQGKTITLYNNADTDWNVWTNAESITVKAAFKNAATESVLLTVPANAVYLYVTAHPALGDTRLVAEKTEWLEKSVDENTAGVATNAESISALTPKVVNTPITLTPVQTYAGKYIANTNVGATSVSMTNSATQDVLKYDISDYWGRRLYLKDGYAQNIAWTDTDDVVKYYNKNVSVSEADGIDVRTGCKYMYITVLKTESNKLYALSDGAYNVSQNEKVIMRNMFTDPLFTDASNWNTSITPSSGKIIGVDVTANFQFSQQKQSIQTNVGDKIYVGFTLNSQNGIYYIYSTLSTGSTSKNGVNHSMSSVFNYPCHISDVISPDALASNGANNKVSFNIFKGGDATMGFEIVAPVCINLTQVFGAGHEPNADVIDALIDGIGGHLDGSVDITNAAVLLNSLKMLPQNGAYFRTGQYGNVEMGSAVNPNWPMWSMPQYSYGLSSAKAPIYNYVHGVLETDAMFSAHASFSRWSSYGGTGVDADGNPIIGGHVFEGWNYPRTNRVTILIANHYEDEADLIVYKPAGLDEGGGKHGRVRLGSDFLKQGYVVAPHYMEAYGDIVFYNGYYPKIKSPDGTIWAVRVNDDGELYTVKDETFTFRDDG